MQNEKNESKFQVNVSKTIKCPAIDVFRAIGEGRLFFNCGANSEKSKIDFKVGGEYLAAFPQYGFTNRGSFLEIVPHEKIVFTWCQNPSESSTPDTTVTIRLKEENRQTTVNVVHTGFKNQAGADNHEGGWNGGLTDLGAEMAEGTLKFMRYMEAPLDSIYKKCATPENFFGELGDLSKGHVDFKVGGTFRFPTEKGEISGAFTEIVPNEKIVFSWNSTCASSPAANTVVTLTFEKEEDDGSDCWLGLVHTGLTTESQQKSHREGWDYLLAKLRG